MIEHLRMWPLKLKRGEELADNFCRERSASIPKNIKRIAFFGMGGSGSAGHCVKTLLDKQGKLPSMVINSHGVPDFFDGTTLAIVCSYSGNTWETVAALSTLIKRFIPTVVIAHAGQAIYKAQEYNVPFILVPESAAPRQALGDFLGIILVMLDRIGVYSKGAQLVASWSTHARTYLSKFEHQQGYQEFFDLVADRSYFHIFGVSSDTDAVALRIQTQFNENSKLLSTLSLLPEAYHNLICGFQTSTSKPLVLLCRTDFIDSSLAHAVDTGAQIIREHGSDLYKVPLFGDTWEDQLFSMILWGDFASYYLAVKRNLNVLATPLIDKLKQRLKSAKKG